MILHSNKFNVQARLRFQPFEVEWGVVSAETVEWVETQRVLGRAFSTPQQENPGKDWLKVRIELPDMDSSKNVLGMFPGFGLYPTCTVLIDRASMPLDVLDLDVNYLNTPDISGRSFSVLVCRKSEFKDVLWNLAPGNATKNAWAMQNEFLNLSLDNDDDWPWALTRFLNKWGLWDCESGFMEDRKPPMLAAPGSISAETKHDRPDFVLLMPHLLRQQQQAFRKALPEVRARQWLRSHPLTLEPEETAPYLFVRQHYCKGAIEATITIDHLAKRQSVICPRCTTVFPPEPRQIYCSRTCASGAGVERFRESKKEEARKKARGRK